MLLFLLSIGSMGIPTYLYVSTIDIVLIGELFNCD